MNKKHNYKIIVAAYILTGILFVFSATAITLYSLGYRYNFSRHEIIKTGILRLNPIADNSEILIDDSPVEPDIIRNSIDIPNLLPNQYNIKIINPLYQTWEKKITIEPNKIHNENNIILIPKVAYAEDIIYIKNYQKSQFSNLIGYINIDHLETINPENLVINKYSDFKITNNQFKWLNNNIIAQIEENDQSTTINTINLQNTNQVKKTIDYHISLDDLITVFPLQPNIILYQRENDIYSLDLTKPENTKIYQANVTHPKFHSQYLYFISENSDNNEQSILTIINLTSSYSRNLNLGKKITNLYPTDNPDIIVYSTDKNSNTVLSINQNKTYDFPGSVSRIITSPDQKKLLILSENEINLINLQSTDKITSNTIIRLSQPIIDCIWLNNGNILYSFNNQINRIDSEGHNNQEIIKMENTKLYLPSAIYPKILAVAENNDQKLLKTIYIDLSNLPNGNKP